MATDPNNPTAGLQKGVVIAAVLIVCGFLGGALIASGVGSGNKNDTGASAPQVADAGGVDAALIAQLDELINPNLSTGRRQEILASLSATITRSCSNKSAVPAEKKSEFESTCTLIQNIFDELQTLQDPTLIAQRVKALKVKLDEMYRFFISGGSAAAQRAVQVGIAIVKANGNGVWDGSSRGWGKTPPVPYNRCDNRTKFLCIGSHTFPEGSPLSGTWVRGDCSGFTGFVLQKAGVFPKGLAPTTASMRSGEVKRYLSDVTTQVAGSDGAVSRDERKNLVPGDLIVDDGHVILYIGNQPEGEAVESTGSRGRICRNLGSTIYSASQNCTGPMFSTLDKRAGMLSSGTKIFRIN
jgi:hypothetical protein